MNNFFSGSKFQSLCGALTIFIAAICLAGWYTNNLILAAFNSNFIMMAPSTGICFFMLGIALWASDCWKIKPRLAIILNLLIFIPSAISVFELISFCSGLDSILDRLLSGTIDRQGNIPIGRMSSITAILFLFSFPGLYLAAFKTDSLNEFYRNCVSVLTLFVILTGFVIIVAYWYGVPVFYKGSYVPPALPTVFCFFILNTGVFCRVGKNTSLFGEFFGNSIFGKLVRNMVPMISVLVLLEGWTDTSNIQFFSNQALAHSIFTLIVIAVIIAIVAFASRSVSLQLSTAAAEKRASDERFRTVTSLAPIGIYLTDSDGNCLYANPAWCQMAGLKLEEATGKGWINGLYPDDRDFVFSNWQRMVETQGHWGCEYRFMTREGKITWVYGLATPQYDTNGKIVSYVGVNQDITERKQFEAEREKAEQQRNQMQKLESLGVLAGGIAHDFNNLLGGIFGFIDMAAEETREKKTASHLSKALGTIDRARALTQQLLTFAKGGAPVQKIQPLFPFVLETAQFALCGSNVACRFLVPDNVWECNFDKNQIGQVVDNIVINAQQSMPEGGTLEIAAVNIVLADKEHPLLPEGNYVKLSVKDTGVGIPKQIITKIFDPFFTTKPRGHGLGLATCYSIVKRHGGCITVESEPGQGSTFMVYLPAGTKPAEKENNVKTQIHKGCGNFLIMDDEEVMRETIGAMLESLNYSIICKENGEDAIAHFKENRNMTGMILDLTVPGGMCGKDMVAEIRKIDNAMPIFVVSGYADDPVMKNPAEYGFTASIKKPFRKVELSDMLNKHMKSCE